MIRVPCIALCSMLSVYCLISYAAGKAGLVSLAVLAERIDSMATRAGELAADNARLVSEAKALTSSADRIAREARKIGYLKRDETEILLVGVDPQEGLRPASDGAGIEDVLRVGEIVGLPDILIKQIALVAGLGAAFVLSFMRLSSSRTQKSGKKTTGAESTVAEASAGAESA
jgi:cell division protein FtsB